MPDNPDPSIAEAPTAAELGSGLPPALDRYLKRTVDSAFKQCRKTRFPAERLAAALSHPTHDRLDLEAVLTPLRERPLRSAAETHACAWMLGIARLESMEKAAAVQTVSGVVRRPATYTSMARKSSRLVLARASVAALFLAAFATFGIETGAPALLFTFAGLTVTMFASAIQLIRANKKNVRALRFLAAHALGRIGAVEGIGALAEAARDKDERLAAMAKRSLRLLLPRLTEAHYGALDAAATSGLYDLLNHRASLERVERYTMLDYSFRLDLLTAIEKVGEPRAARTVAEASMTWPEKAYAGGVEARPREAAERVLAVLVERRRLLTVQSTLLRPAAQAESRQAELLRAATARTETGPEQLLRPLPEDP